MSNDTTTTGRTTAGPTTTGPTTGPTTTAERTDLLGALAAARYFLRFTVRELSDEQARARTTVSRLSLGGLIKHVARQEASWLAFILDRPGAPTGQTPAGVQEHEQSLVMAPGETLEGLLGRYEAVARQTDETVRTLPDLDVSRPLPPAPWFEPGARWSARQTLLHIIAETAQHAGHADIIRESLDGARSMG